MGDIDTDDDFGSSSELLRKIEPDELRIMAEALRELQSHPGFVHLSRLLRLEREVGVRRMTGAKLLEHADYAYSAGKIRGLAGLWVVLQKVEATHRAVQASLAREQRQDGESNV